MISMTPGVRYIVTKASDDGTFWVGDRIVSEACGVIYNADVPGWLAAEDVAEATLGMEVETDRMWVAQRRAQLLAQLTALGPRDDE